MTTMSPGASAGTRTCLTSSRKPAPLMEPSRSWGAVTPLSRSPATSVVFLRCPCGTAARRRTPLGARPYRRAMVVEAKLSSTNTSFDRPSAGCLSSTTACAAGLRASEVAGLRVADIDSGRGVILVRHGKGGDLARPLDGFERPCRLASRPDHGMNLSYYML